MFRWKNFSVVLVVMPPIGRQTLEFCLKRKKKSKKLNARQHTANLIEDSLFKEFINVSMVCGLTSTRSQMSEHHWKRPSKNCSISEFNGEGLSAKFNANYLFPPLFGRTDIWSFKLHNP